MYDASIQVNLVGCQFYGKAAKDIYYTLERGTKLKAVRNPLNPRDVFAVEVLALSEWTDEWTQIGHLEAAHARKIEPWIAYFDALPGGPHYTLSYIRGFGFRQSRYRFAQLQLEFHNKQAAQSVTSFSKGAFNQLTAALPYDMSV